MASRRIADSMAALEDMGDPGGINIRRLPNAANVSCSKRDGPPAGPESAICKMNVVQAWQRFKSSTHTYRARFGSVRGLLVWVSLQRGKFLGKGSRYRLWIPGLCRQVWLRAGTSDRQVFEEIIVGDELGFDVGTRPATILDLGANIGLSSIYLANRFPKARILALEVDPGNVELLRLNTMPYPGITVVPKAIWHHDGHVRIENPDDQPWAFKVADTSADAPGAIEAVSIPTLLREYGWSHVDLVKMDIEGTERDLFEAGNHDWLRQVSVLAVELHDRFREGCSRALTEALRDVPHHSLAREYYSVVFMGDD